MATGATMNDSTRLVATRELLQALPQRTLADMCVEAQAQSLELERKNDEMSDRLIEINRIVGVAAALLGTVVTVVGGRDLLTMCEVVRTELIRLRETRP